MSDDVHDFDLVMPFVTVVSVGGPHDDVSYTAGWEMGSLDRRLTHLAVTGGTTMNFIIRRENKPQADLIAMQHDYTMVMLDDDDAPWIAVTFTREDVR